MLKIALINIIVAGFLFGVWPIIMNKSGLPGFASAAIFSGVSFITCVTVALMSGQMQQVELFSQPVLIGVVAAVIGAAGLLAFNSGLAGADPKTVGSLLIIMILVQLAVPAVHQMFLSGSISVKTSAGIAMGLGAAWLMVS